MNNSSEQIKSCSIPQEKNHTDGRYSEENVICYGCHYHKNGSCNKPALMIACSKYYPHPTTISQWIKYIFHRCKNLYWYYHHKCSENLNWLKYKCKSASIPSPIGPGSKIYYQWIVSDDNETHILKIEKLWVGCGNNSEKNKFYIMAKTNEGQSTLNSLLEYKKIIKIEK